MIMVASTVNIKTLLQQYYHCQIDFNVNISWHQLPNMCHCAAHLLSNRHSLT